MGDDGSTVEGSFADIDPAMRQAIEMSFDAVRAGSLGIGAVVTRPDGQVVATGRNRLHEEHAGDDHIAGSSLAHAEINALAKLRFRAHETDELVLSTTLQPCLQCLGAIRLSPVRSVRVLAPDPLWVGIEQMRDLVAHVGVRWPTIQTLPTSPWSVLTLLSPTRHALAHPVIGPPWRDALPTTSELAADVDPAAIGTGSVTTFAGRWWTDLEACVDEVERLAVRSRLTQA